MATLNDTVEIQLTQGEVGVISAEDADLLCFHWVLFKNRGGMKYIQRERTHGAAYMHRIILSRMLGRTLLKHELTDHINGNGTDNRRCNLRLASASQNQANSKKPRNNASGVKGVWYDRKRKKWTAQIKHNYRNIVIGRYDTKEEARLAREAKARELQGEFFRP